jgi:hypothetical protein
MKLTFAVALFAIGIATSAVSAQQKPFPLTDKLTNLAGTWVRDPARGTGGICGVNPADSLTITLTGTEMLFSPAATPGATAISGTVRLDGSTTMVSGGTTMRRERSGGFVNVLREVYIPLRGELTIWRTLNVERPDGGPDKIDCGNHHAIVYVKK